MNDTTLDAPPSDLKRQASARPLLVAGIIATPLFFTVALTRAATQADFELGRHVLSQLAIGNLGWVQTVNFIATGLLFVLTAIGVRRAMPDGPGRTWAPRMIGAFGAGLVAAGVFPIDPLNDYPTADTDTTWHGAVHGVVAIVSAVALVAAAAVLARRFFAEKRRAAAILTAICGAAYLVVPFVNPEQPGIPLVVGSLIGWGWLSAYAGWLTTTRCAA